MLEKRVWFHIILSTYGCWLPGDPRGFRTRHHREHVEGDYKHPPPEGLYDQRHQHSRKLLTQPPTIIPAALRPVIGGAVRERFEQKTGRVLSISCGGQHVHVQVQLPDGDARHTAGLAKRHATFVAHANGFEGKLWALRPKIVRIKSRTHHGNVYRYILDHVNEGAWVWSEPKSQEASEAQG
ncbi:MAG TPA: hypothetical protein VM165_19805 [Planctomycetaceae bacterium]|nr:hypothetical protein [Planctomycetaceae bacterium]